MLTNGHIESGLSAVLEFIYPTTCLICDTSINEPGELVCPECWNRIGTFDYIFCGNCEQTLSDNLKCLDCSDADVMPIMALGRYSDPLAEIVRCFKYRSFKKLGQLLANMLIDNHSDLLKKLKIDAIIPVPLHSYRLKTRGFNQSLILADIIGKRLNIPVIQDLLIKIKSNKYQKSLDPMRRDKNVRGVYWADVTKMTGKNILLVDDVITTGATLREAIRVIGAAGGKVILSGVIAATGTWK